MLRKTFQLLKNNPNIIILQVIYIVILFLNKFILYSVSQSELTVNISYVLYSGNFFISFVFSILLGIVFMSGFGNVLSETITSGKSGVMAFFEGTKKNLIKSTLSALILYIIYFVFSTILPPIVLQIILDLFAPYVEVRREFYYIFIYIINIIIMPFTVLFLPAIFIDHYDIIAGLITGIKLAVRNYRKLVWVLSAMYIPIIINIIFIKDSVMFVFAPISIEYIINPIDAVSGNIFSVSFIIMYILEAAIFLVSAPLFFIIYKESSSKRLLY